MKKMLTVLLVTLSVILYNTGQLSGKPFDIHPDETFGKPLFIADTLEPVANKDTTEIRFKDKKIRITEDDDGTTMEIEEKNGVFDKGEWEELDWADDQWNFGFDKEEDEAEKATNGTARGIHFNVEEDEGFDLHWAGFEIGMNNYLNANWSMALDESHAYMDLNTGKSWNVNLNLLEYDLNLIGQNFGFGTGLGIEFNDYRFDNQLPLKKGDGQIQVDSMYANSGYNLEKAKLTTTYLTVPLIFEYQVKVSGEHKVFLSAGIIGGMKLGSHSKVVYKSGGDKNKDKNRSDFYLSPFRYGYTARVGYGFLKLFANYYDTALFQKDKGPELYPFSIGFMISF